MTSRPCIAYVAAASELQLAGPGWYPFCDIHGLLLPPAPNRLEELEAHTLAGLHMTEHSNGGINPFTGLDEREKRIAAFSAAVRGVPIPRDEDPPDR